MSFSIRFCVGALALFLVTASVDARTDDETPVIEYRCNDVVAVGRVKTLNFADLSLPDDLLGNGKFSMEVSLKKILKGEEPRQVVPATQTAHAQLREDRDFIVVLSPQAGGSYTLRYAYSWKSRPKPVLAERCTD